MTYKGWYAVKKFRFTLPNLYDLESNFSSTFLTETIAIFPTPRNLFRTSRWVKWKQNFKWISFFPYSLWLFTKIFAEVAMFNFLFMKYEWEDWLEQFMRLKFPINECLPSQLMCVLSLMLFENIAAFWFLSKFGSKYVSLVLSVSKRGEFDSCWLPSPVYTCGLMQYLVLFIRVVQLSLLA